MRTSVRLSLTGAVILLAVHFFDASLNDLFLMVCVMAINLVFQAWIRPQIELTDQRPDGIRPGRKQRLQQWGQAVSGE